MTKIIYIAGYGRSGSTMLDRLLSAHPAIAGGGEIFRAPVVFADTTAQCTCGARFADCQVWSGFRGAVKRAGLAHGGHRAQCAAYAAHEGRSARRGGCSGISAEWERLNGLAMTALAGSKEDVEFVVDGSKTARAAARRPQRLAEAGHDVRLIVLRRDLRSVLRSVAKGSNQALEAGQGGLSLMALARAAVGWWRAQAAARRAAAHLPSIDLRWEDMQSDPEAALTRIADWLGLEAGPMIAGLYAPPEAGHVLSGNRARFARIPFQRKRAA